MHCPNCAADNRDTAKFCSECGTALALRCPSCGTPHLADQAFCDECGAGLAQAADPAVQGAAHPPSDPELRMASVLFVDLVGFTSLSEARDAEDVRELLSGYFDAARTIVERYGGTIQKFIGDAVMAVWGVPKANEDDAELAVRAALEIVDAVTAFGEATDLDGLRARAGVVTGQVAAQANPDEGLVVGDRVNTAARVQTAAEPGTVLVDEITRQVTSAAIAYEDAGEHALKGKEGPARLWRPTRVLGRVGGALRESGPEAQLVGRDADLRLLKDLFHAGVDRGLARLVAVSGPAGVGKSRLRREFDHYTDGLADPFLFHTGRCPPYGEGAVYWSLAEMVRQRLGIPEEASAEEAVAKLDAGLDRWITSAADREFLVPRLGALLGIAEPGLARAELFAGWRMFFERLAEHQPVVLIFEDLQWAADGLLDFIENLLEWSTERPIFILGLARPELGEHRDGWPGGVRGATVIHLEPLPDAAIGELLDGLVRTLPAEARARIVSQAEGIPLYAIEMVRALADRGVLVEAGGRLELAGELGELDVPASLSSLLAARLDALEPSERDLIRTMSVFGSTFPRSAAAALSDVPDDRLDAVLNGLVRKQVLAIRADPLSPDRGQYAFSQSLLRTVAYEMLSRRERKARHRAAADHLREAFPDRGEDVAELIAAHLLDAHAAASGDADADELRGEALAELHRAAHRAETVGAPEAAEQAYRTAIDLVEADDERVALLEAAGRMAKLAARWDSAVELLEAAAEAHRAAGREVEAARIVGVMAKPLRHAGRAEEAVERMRAAFEVLDPDDQSPEIAELNLELSAALALTGRADESAEPVERALAAAEALDLPDTLGPALMVSGFAYGFASRFQQERGLYRTAIEIARRHELTQDMLIGHVNLGESLAQTDDPESDEVNLVALGLARRIGDRASLCYVAASMMYRRLLTGDWAEVDELAAEVLDADRDDSFDDQLVQMRLASLHALRGELGSATGLLGRLDLLRPEHDYEAGARLRAAEAAVALADGRPADALEHATAVLERSDRLGTSHESTRTAWPVAVEAALALDRLNEAEALIDEVEQRPRGHVSPLVRGELLRLRALFAVARGAHDEVEADLSAAAATYAELGYPYLLARVDADLGEWLIGRGRRDEALVALGRAGETFARLGAVPAADRVAPLLVDDGAAAVRG